MTCVRNARHFRLLPIAAAGVLLMSLAALSGCHKSVAKNEAPASMRKEPPWQQAATVKAAPPWESNKSIEPYKQDVLTGESYERRVDSPFMLAADNPLSTFSIDVDTASYSNVRRFLKEGQLPPKDAVRIEELVNYFHFDYPAPEDGTPFAVTSHVAECPWNRDHRLVLLGLQAR